MNIAQLFRLLDGFRDIARLIQPSASVLCFFFFSLFYLGFRFPLVDYHDFLIIQLVQFPWTITYYIPSVMLPWKGLLS